MPILSNPVHDHRVSTESLAKDLKPTDVYHWLVECGYFPEAYVLPPCFKVNERPKKMKRFVGVTKKGKGYKVGRSQLVNVHFPKSEYTDRRFGIMNPEIHNDIAYHLAKNWRSVVKALVPKKSMVTSYSFPLPITSLKPGRLGHLRSGRLIYEFIGMVDKDIASIAYRYNHLLKTDIKNFYPSIYTHSIAWALHGKKFVRKPQNLHNYNLLGNRLDRLFQCSNDGCTNGVAIGPVVSDIAAEIVASGVDCELTGLVNEARIDCEIIRFKDDYRVLAKTEADARAVVKYLQRSLAEYNLELNDEKTSLTSLPDGLFREWVSKYHVVHPRKRKFYRWKEFRELYLAVLRIDRECPGTGVIDRFLADIVSNKGKLKVRVRAFNLLKVLSMLLMLANLRIKSFPKVFAIIESVLRSPFGLLHQGDIVGYLEEYLEDLSKDEERNKYLIAWISYFLVSNNLQKVMKYKPKYKDPITRSVFNNRGMIFKTCTNFKLFIGCRKIGSKVTMLEHLDIFNPPEID